MLDHRTASALMLRCIDLAHKSAKSGNYALGSLIFLNGNVIYETGSDLASGNDPTAHPELVCIQKSAARLGNRYIEGGILVSTLEPCPMCAAGAIWAKMSGVIFGASQEDALNWSARHQNSKHSWRQIKLSCQNVVSLSSPPIWVMPEVMRDECCGLFDVSG